MRCEARATCVPAALVWGPVLARAMGDAPVAVRCTRQAGHGGTHEGTVCPFPGFADVAVTWGGR